MSSLLLRDVLLEGERTHVLVEDNLITEVGRRREADRVIEADGKILLPGLINTHTHAAMSLLRGYADDMPLHSWLQEKIWPLEARLTPRDVLAGTKLACLEMIKSGTTCFNDMYFHMDAAADAVKAMGLRAVLSYGFIDLFDEAKGEVEIKRSQETVKYVRGLRSTRIVPALGPHAAYTVSASSLGWIKEYADAEKLLIHFHLAETREEADNLRAKVGKGVVAYLEDLGFLGSNLVAAHCIWVDAADIALLADRGVKVSHNPTSNMKLASGTMPYRAMRDRGLVIALGTDGPSSNNNLDMFEAMKFAALLHKLSTGDPTVLPASEALTMATVQGAAALGLRAGRVAPGHLADLILVDPWRPAMVPLHHGTSNVVYGGNGSCVDTVVCDGRVLMKDGRVRGEAAILREAGEAARRLAEGTD